MDELMKPTVLYKSWPRYCTSLSLLIILLSSCIHLPETIRDIHDIPQDHTQHITADYLFMSEEDQKISDAKYNILFFSPWHRTKPVRSLESVRKSFHALELNPGYGENKREHEVSWVTGLLDNAALDHYPNAGFPGITLYNTDLRILPTHKPVFRSAGGYPFDRLQESLIAPHTPLYISHISRDRAWFLVETPYANGWIDVRHVLRVDETFMQKWQNGSYAVVIEDEIPVYDDQSHFLFKAPLGAIFPAVGETDHAVRILHASADANRKAVIRESRIKKDAIAIKPLRMTGINMARVANRLMMKPYGWGGLYENRDCSATLRDLFAPFGIWLSRHSSDQAKRDGHFFDLASLSPEEKKNTILRRGIPYMTLLWMKGHIMLYIGQFQGEPLVFHNFWGVTTTNLWGIHGRLIVGHTAITTLHPARVFHYALPGENSFLQNIIGMTRIGDIKNTNGLRDLQPEFTAD